MNLVEAQALNYCLSYLNEYETSVNGDFKKLNYSFIWQANNTLFSCDFLKIDKFDRVLTDFDIRDIDIMQNHVVIGDEDSTFITKIRIDLHKTIRQNFFDIEPLLKDKEALFQFLISFINNEKEMLQNYSPIKSNIYNIHELATDVRLGFYQIPEPEKLNIVPVSLISRS